MPGLAQLVRSKYPGVYDDLSDQELEAKVTAKYPGVYDDLKTATAAPKAQETPSTPSRLARSVGAGPAVGATVGAMAGGVPGAALGGAAGRGYQDLIEHAKEIPGAVVDVARNLFAYPKETAAGFAKGAASGAADAGLSAGANAAMEAGGQAAIGALGKAGEAVYRGYLKPSLAKVSVGKAQQIVKTAIAEALPITKEAVGAANRRIATINAAVNQILTKPGESLSEAEMKNLRLKGDIDLHDVAERLRSWGQSVYGKPGRAPEDLEAVMKVADRLDAHPSMPVEAAGKPQPVSLTQAQDVKQGIYQTLGDTAYGTERGASVAAQKMAAKTIKQELEERAPSIAGLNKRESQLIDTAKAIRQAVERESNQNALVGVKSVLAAGAGGEEYRRTGNPAAAIATAMGARFLMTPAVASRAAIVASRLSQRVPGIAPATAARVALAVLSESEQPKGGGQ